MNRRLHRTILQPSQRFEWISFGCINSIRSRVVEGCFRDATLSVSSMYDISHGKVEKWFLLSSIGLKYFIYGLSESGIKCCLLGDARGLKDILKVRNSRLSHGKTWFNHFPFCLEVSIFSFDSSEFLYLITSSPSVRREFILFELFCSKQTYVWRL